MKEVGWWVLDESNTPQFVGTGIDTFRDHSTRVWKRIAVLDLGAAKIETVFIGCDVNSPPEGPPMLFETTVSLYGITVKFLQAPTYYQGMINHHKAVDWFVRLGWLETAKLLWEVSGKRLKRSWRRLRNRVGKNTSEDSAQCGGNL